MNALLRCLSITLLLTAASVKTVFAAGPFEELAKYVPSSANALFIINVEAALNTPLARQSDWALKKESAFESGMIIIPPKATHFVLASEIDLEFMEPKWEIAVADMPDGPKTNEIAAKHGTQVDNIDGKPAVPLSSDAYIVRLTNETYGAIAPANRQTTARWIQQAKGKNAPSLSPYLREAVGYADNVGTEVVLALDMTDILTPGLLLQKLGELKTLAGKDVNHEQLATAVASLRGVTMGVLIDKGLTGALKVDFREDISALAPFAKPLLLEVLGNHGAMIDDFANWEVKVTDRRITLSGSLSESGGRQVMSVVDARTSSFLAAGQFAGQDGQNGQDGIAEATLRYFKSVNILLRDLDALSPKTKTWGQKGMWYDQYARKIEGLPMLNVDPEMLDYGQYVSFALRDASAALKEIGARSRYRQVNTALVSPGHVYTGYGYGPNGLGWSLAYGDASAAALQQQGREKSRIRTEERITGTSKANAIMTEIEKATATVRRLMIERHKLEF